MTTYNDCDCVPGHRCDCWDYRAEPRAEGLPATAQAVLDTWPEEGVVVTREQARVLMQGARLPDLAEPRAEGLRDAALRELAEAYGVSPHDNAGNASRLHLLRREVLRYLDEVATLPQPAALREIVEAICVRMENRVTQPDSISPDVVTEWRNVLRVALAATLPQQAALDVERLARALVDVLAVQGVRLVSERDGLDVSPDSLPQDIARAYADQEGGR